MDELSQSKKSSSSSNELLLQAQTSLSTHIFNFTDSMSLKCAVELGIPDAIRNHNGGDTISLPDLLSALSISSSKKTHLRRLMRLLAHSGIFAATQNDEGEDLYSLTPVSALLVNDKSGGSQQESLSPFLLFVLQPFVVDTFQSMSSWFKEGGGGGGEGENTTVFASVHGCDAWEFNRRDPKANEQFNEAMRCNTKFLMRFLLDDCGFLFEGVKILVDVGGGTGVAAAMISEAFPGIKCGVLDLPQVASSVMNDEMKKKRVEFLPGNMFDHVPPADAVFLKNVLHNWRDDDCVKILKRCKEAISSRDGGKVIIVEIVIGSDASHRDSTRAQLYYDMMMLVSLLGAERNETEWKKIFNEAGFTNYKFAYALGWLSVIELYP